PVRALAALEIDAPAQGILVREVAAHQRLVDDGGRRPARGVPRVEHAAPLERNAQRREIAWTRRPGVGMRLLLLRPERAPLDVEAAAVAGAAQRQLGDGARGEHVRPVPQADEDVLEKPGSVRDLAVAGAGKLHLRGKDVAGAEP